MGKEGVLFYRKFCTGKEGKAKGLKGETGMDERERKRRRIAVGESLTLKTPVSENRLENVLWKMVWTTFFF